MILLDLKINMVGKIFRLNKLNFLEYVFYMKIKRDKSVKRIFGPGCFLGEATINIIADKCKKIEINVFYKNAQIKKILR